MVTDPLMLALGKIEGTVKIIQEIKFQCWNRQTELKDHPMYLTQKQILKVAFIEFENEMNKLP